jgi:5-hydroxyisourate hydrolase
LALANRRSGSKAPRVTGYSAARLAAADGSLRRTDVIMGRLTTHVLDTAAGKPAAGLTVELYRIGKRDERLAVATTNAEGRVDRPLLEGEALTSGVYELRFHAGDYLRENARLPEPPFLDIVPVRFGIAAPREHYHVPLILSPYGYASYRGS